MRSRPDFRCAWSSCSSRQGGEAAAPPPHVTSPRQRRRLGDWQLAGFLHAPLAHARPLVTASSAPPGDAARGAMRAWSKGISGLSAAAAAAAAGTGRLRRLGPRSERGFTTQQSEIIVSALVKIMNTNMDVIYKDMVTKVQQLPEANPVSRVVSRPSLRQSNGRQSFRAFFLCGRHTTASMEPAQLTLAIRSTLTTTRIIQQYMQHQNMATRYRARRRRQRGPVSDQDMDTDFSESMGPDNACIMVLMGQVHAVERRFWARETSTDWWDRIVLQVWDNSQWLRNFCMRKGTFMELCDLLSPALKRMNTKMRAALTVEKRVAIALWKLATPDSYRSVGNQFGVGKSTVGAAVMQVAHAIKDLLISRVVTLGNVQVIVDGFAAMGFPNCGGAIDGTHIPILAPEHQAAEYINRKGYFSIVLQALVDHKGCFTNISVGCFKSCRKGLYSQTRK
nr:mitochondrial calcium uniporter regulator 1 isoform X2 [Caretta caretta]